MAAKSTTQNSENQPSEWIDEMTYQANKHIRYLRKMPIPVCGWVPISARQLQTSAIIYAKISA